MMRKPQRNVFTLQVKGQLTYALPEFEADKIIPNYPRKNEKLARNTVFSFETARQGTDAVSPHDTEKSKVTYAVQ